MNYLIRLRSPSRNPSTNRPGWGSTEILHVPLKGGAPAMTALIIGENASGLFDFVSLKPYVESGKARLLAVTGSHRHAWTPAVPTLSELGYTGFELGGTPQAPLAAQYKSDQQRRATLIKKSATKLY